jgi:hypothetical protein
MKPNLPLLPKKAAKKQIDIHPLLICLVQYVCINHHPLHYKEI